MASLPVATLDVAKLNRTILCYAETIYRFNGVWEGPNPLTPLISLFLIQLTFSMCIIHLVVFSLKPFNQPPFVAELLVSHTSIYRPFVNAYASGPRFTNRATLLSGLMDIDWKM